MPYFLIFLLGIVFSSKTCKVNEDYCKKCNPITNVCAECFTNVLVPSKDGVCVGASKCYLGQNYCEECNEEETLCSSCVEGYFPDGNGGCTYTNNCLISYNGRCLFCAENYFLVGSTGICKSKSNPDFVNCEKINEYTGYCEECEEDYFLTEVDKRCISTDNCTESKIGKCVLCSEGFYLDQKDKRKCKSILENQIFEHCKETEDGKTCSKCQDGYHLDEKNKECVSTKFCAESDGKYKCKKCVEGYYLSKYGNTCTKQKNCYGGDGDLGLCGMCLSNFYLDRNDAKCKSNQEEEDDLYHCSYFYKECEGCVENYVLSEDKKCTNTKNCLKVKKGVCTKCQENFSLLKNNQCSNIKHCIDNSKYYPCYECEEGYYFNRSSGICYKEDDLYENCRITNSFGSKCAECKNGFYLNLTDNLCYSNEKKREFLHCAESNLAGKKCNKCEEGYYLSFDEKLCTSVQYCAEFETDDEGKDKCTTCEEYFCLDLKKGTCEYGDYVEEEENKIYYKCLKTNKNGDACGKCLEGFELSEAGLCVDVENCQQFNDDKKCKKCKEGYCLNKDFGCVETFFNEHCLECDDINFNLCTKCEKGYTFAEDKEICVEEEE